MTSSVCLFMVVVGCVHSIETQTNKTQLKLSIQSCICLIILVRVSHLDDLLGHQLALALLVTLLSTRQLLLQCLELDAVDTSNISSMAWTSIHSASPLMFSVWFSRRHTSGNSAEQNRLCVIMTTPPPKSLMAPARAASESRSRELVG